MSTPVTACYIFILLVLIKHISKTYFSEETLLVVLTVLIKISIFFVSLKSYC